MSKKRTKNRLENPIEPIYEISKYCEEYASKEARKSAEMNWRDPVYDIDGFAECDICGEGSDLNRGEYVYQSRDGTRHICPACIDNGH